MYYLVTDTIAPPLPVRYRWITYQPPVVLDCEADRPPTIPLGELPHAAHPYQHLNAFRWAIPEVETWMLQSGDDPCLLLAGAPLEEDGTPCPTLASAWK
jgi:hypothetical protein